jgi:hypothetical protein
VILESYSLEHEAWKWWPNLGRAKAGHATQQGRRWHQIHLGALLVIVALFALSFSLHPVITPCVAGSIIGAFLSQVPTGVRDRRVRQCLCTVMGGMCASIIWLAGRLLSIEAQLNWQGVPSPGILKGLMISMWIGFCVGIFTWVALRVARYY